MPIIETKKLKQSLLEKVKFMRDNISKDVCLTILLDGGNLASKKYVEIKQRVAKVLNISVEVLTQKDEINSEKINQSAVIVQLPTTDKFREYVNQIKISQDVDLLNPRNQLELINKGINPPTIQSIIDVMDYYYSQILSNPTNRILGQKVLIIGQGVLVGRMLAFCLILKGYTVISANEFTKDLHILARNSDIVVSATGVPELVDLNFINQDGKNQLFIDAGTAESNGELVGDICLELGQQKGTYLCPSPGGIGPLTVLNLFSNCCTLKQLSNKNLL